MELPGSAEEICERILDVSDWTSFEGYGPIPAIAAARISKRTEELVGTRIEVANADGSRHVEEIVHFVPGRELTLKMASFSRPLDALATHFFEHWRFEPKGDSTAVQRSFELHPKSVLTVPLLWLIGRLLARAVARHLARMRER
jgi:hypothetical protein